MKFLLSAFVSLFAVGVQAKEQMVHMESVVKANSKFGRSLLTEARRVESSSNSSAVAYNETWLAGYSIVFQGCHHISQWNDEAETEDDVRIATKRLVRFRLCPSDTCSGSSGCSSNYGDYIVDMGTYLKNWFAAKEDYQLFQCEYLAKNVCKCDNEEGAENFNADECIWECFAGHNMAAACSVKNPNGDDSSSSAVDLDQYMECTDSGLKANNSNRNLQYGYSDNWDGKFYIGPYCASQGGAIFIGMFLDDSCSNFADSTGGQQTYYDLTSKDLPYGSTNVIDMDCLSCKEPSTNNYAGNDANDTDVISDVCEQLYTTAGKCEQTYSEGVVQYPNNNACNYMEGIKIVRKDGTVISSKYAASKPASIFIGTFVISFIILAAYAFYLKTKLDRASIHLNE